MTAAAGVKAAKAAPRLRNPELQQLVDDAATTPARRPRKTARRPAQRAAAPRKKAAATQQPQPAAAPQTPAQTPVRPARRAAPNASAARSGGRSSSASWAPRVSTASNEIAGGILAAFLWAWVGLPFLKNGVPGVKAVLLAKFFNKAPNGDWLK